jgi:hypothetical protein
MTDWTKPLGANAHLRCVKTATLKASQGQLLARIARDTDSAIQRPTRGTAAGDRMKLRGIPTIGVGGAIPGQNEYGKLMQQKPNETYDDGDLLAY